jgi:hypothetical protein
MFDREISSIIKILKIIREICNVFLLRYFCVLGGSHHQSIPDTFHQDETDISLVTGKIRTLGHGDDNIETGQSLVLRSEAMTVATQAESAGILVIFSDFWHTTM